MQLIQNKVNTLTGYINVSQKPLMTICIIWGACTLFFILSLCIYDSGKLTSCRTFEYVMWVIIFILTFIGLPSAAILFPSAIATNNLCNSLNDMYNTQFSDFKLFDSNVHSIFEHCSESSDGDILKLFNVDIDISLLNQTIVSDMLNTMSYLGSTTLQLPVHNALLLQYQSYYQNANYLEIIYGSSLSVLLTNAGAELSLDSTVNPVFVAFTETQCPSISSIIYSDTLVTGKNKCIIISPNASLHAFYSGKKIEYLYNYRKDIYDLITGNALSLNSSCIGMNQAELVAIKADYDPLIANLENMNTTLHALVDLTKNAFASLNCTIIGVGIKRIIVGLCGNTMYVISGVAITLVICSVSSAFVVVFAAVFNKLYSHPNKFNEVRLSSPPIEGVGLKVSEL